MRKNKINFVDTTLGILHNLEDVLMDLIGSFTWGNAYKQTIATKDDIQNWFLDVPLELKKKTYFGAVAKISEVGSNNIRIFQGIFNKKNQCLFSRQLLVGELDDELNNEFGSTELLIYFVESKDDRINSK